MRTRKSKSSRRIRRKYSKVRRKTTKRRLRTKRRNRYRTKNRSRHNTRRARHKRTRRSKRMTHGTKNLNKFVLVKNMRGGANCLCDDDLDAGVDTELLSKLDNKDIEMEEAYQQAGSEGAMKRFKTAVDAIIKTQRERRKRGPGFADVVKEAMGTGWARVRDLDLKGQKGGGLDVDVQVAYKEFYEIVMSGDMAAFNGTDPNQNSKEWKFCPSELSKHALFLEALKQKIGKTQLLEGFKNYRAHCVWPIMNYYERIFKFYRVA